MRHHGSLFLFALLFACGPGAPNDQPTDADPSTGSMSAGTTNDQPTSDPSTGSMSGTTTAASMTASGTTDIATAGSSGTDAATDAATDATTDATTDAATSTGSTGEPPAPPEPCVPEIDWNIEHLDCLADWPAETKIESTGPAAPLGTITRLLFGVHDEACQPGLSFEPIRIGDPEMPDAVLYYLVAECGPEQWPGAYELKGILADDTEFFTTMTIDGYAGDWQSVNPVDPPRIFGTFTGDLAGAFEAIHCAELDIFINNCG